MKELKIRVRVRDDGTIVVEDAPVKSGQEIEVTLHIPDPVEPTFPLRGLPVRYIDPYLPAVDEGEWDANR